MRPTLEQLVEAVNQLQFYSWHSFKSPEHAQEADIAVKRFKMWCEEYNIQIEWRGKYANK